MERPAKSDSLIARLFFGLAFGAPGLFLVGVGAGAIEVDPSSVRAPYWLIGMLGGMFTLAGAWLATRGTPLESGLKLVVGPAILIGMLVALHWVAFGPGERQCTGSVSIPFLSTRTGVGDLECRTAFGLGAVFFDGIFASVALGHLAEHRLRGRPKRVAEVASKGVLLLVLLPLLPLLLLAILLKAGAAKLGRG